MVSNNSEIYGIATQIFYYVKHWRDTSWYPHEAYTAPVEIAIYGDKVSIISFGDEAAGTILESPQIAHALRDIFNMAKIGARVMTKEVS